MPQVSNMANGTANFQEQTFVAGDGTITTASVDTASTRRVALIKGSISNGATAGTVTARFASEVATSAVTIKKGSWGTSF